MSSANQNRLIILALGLVIAILVLASALWLPPIPALIVNFMTGFSATNFAVWWAWRKSMKDYGMMVMGGAVLALSSVISLGVVSLVHPAILLSDNWRSATALAGLLGPFIAPFVPLAIGGFRQSYPGRLEKWLKPSEVATRNYLKQLQKEAAHHESIMKYRWEGARQAQLNAEASIAEFEARIQLATPPFR